MVFCTVCKWRGLRWRSPSQWSWMSPPPAYAIHLTMTVCYLPPMQYAWFSFYAMVYYHWFLCAELGVGALLGLVLCCRGIFTITSPHSLKRQSGSLRSWEGTLWRRRHSTQRTTNTAWWDCSPTHNNLNQSLTVKMITLITAMLLWQSVRDSGELQLWSMDNGLCIASVSLLVQVRCFGTGEWGPYWHSLQRLCMVSHGVCAHNKNIIGLCVLLCCFFKCYCGPQWTLWML